MPDVPYPKANVLNRFIAKMIDLLFVAALYEISARIGFVAGFLYLLFADGFSQGQSLGKRLIGLKVFVPETQSVCTFRESILRNIPLSAAYLLFFIPFVGWIFTTAILLFEGLLVIGNEQGLRIGDELARTQVLERQSLNIGVER